MCEHKKCKRPHRNECLAIRNGTIIIHLALKMHCNKGVSEALARPIGSSEKYILCSQSRDRKRLDFILPPLAFFPSSVEIYA